MIHHDHQENHNHVLVLHDNVETPQSAETTRSKPTRKRGHILLIDDEMEVLKSLRRYFRKKYHVHIANSAEEGFQIMHTTPIQVVISDQRMPDITGTTLFKKIKTEFPDTVRLLLTGYADIHAVIAAINEGNVFRYITKPWNPIEFDLVVQQAFEHYELITRNQMLVKQLKEANEKLEEHVLQRTAELEKTNTELRREIEKRKKAEKTAKYLAYHDALTGLPNRMLFADRFKMALAHAKRYQQQFALLMLDLDNFKRINDTLGHQVGDQLLVSVSKRLTTLLRQEDTIARMGGDEFMVLSANIKQLDDVTLVSQRILDAFHHPITLNEHTLTVTTSIGIAVYPEHGKDTETLTKHADDAMYQAKKQGRSRYQVYTPSTTD